jgi:hypothetical protein
MARDHDVEVHAIEARHRVANRPDVRSDRITGRVESGDPQLDMVRRFAVIVVEIIR